MYLYKRIKNLLYKLKLKIFYIFIVHPKKTEFCLNFILRYISHGSWDFETFPITTCVIESSTPIDLEKKMSTTEIAKIIIDDIYPTLKNSTYTGIPKYDNGKIIIDHLVITGFKIISTLFDQKNIHCNIDELLSEKKYTQKKHT